MTKSLLTVLVCLLATSAFASSYSGTLTASSGPATTGWNGGPLTGTLGYTGLVGISPPCTPQLCDIYSLTLSIPSNFYSSFPNFGVHVTLNWSSNIQDLDLYVFDSTGNLVGAATTGGTTGEDADLGPLPAGSYQIQVVPASSLATNYAGPGLHCARANFAVRQGSLSRRKFQLYFAGAHSSTSDHQQQSLDTDFLRAGCRTQSHARRGRKSLCGGDSGSACGN